MDTDIKPSSTSAVGIHGITDSVMQGVTQLSNAIRASGLK